LGNADIAIPGDPQVMPSHAVIRRVNGQHQIESHSPLLLVNKRRVDRCSLATGDVLQVGNTSLLYRRRHLVPTASSEARTGMLLPAQTPPPAAAARPSGLRHLQTGERFMLYAITTIGRDGANQIVLTDPAVRARHLEIRYEQDRFILHDLGGGVLVNDRLLDLICSRLDFACVSGMWNWKLCDLAWGCCVLNPKTIAETILHGYHLSSVWCY
jgi:pSer/pThr/pTyr-binding forkhead associated (FHA) protein